MTAHAVVLSLSKDTEGLFAATMVPDFAPVTLLDLRERGLIVEVWVAQQRVVVQLDEEGNLVRVAARHGTEDAQRRGNRFTAAFDGQPHDVLRVEIDGVRSERASGGVFHALVYRKEGEITCPRKRPSWSKACELLSTAGLRSDCATTRST
jgi:hypothetical protein